MNTLGLHVVKPTLMNTLVYLLVLNIFWSLILLFANYFNYQLNHPLLIVTISCFVWHSIASMLGVELHFNYPKNILFHLLGSLFTITIISYLLDF